jgi:hypothetical protein
VQAAPPRAEGEAPEDQFLACRHSCFLPHGAPGPVPPRPCLRMVHRI